MGKKASTGSKPLLYLFATICAFLLGSSYSGAQVVGAGFLAGFLFVFISRM